MEFRPGTMDAYIYQQVVTHNEYNLPQSLPADLPIIDIGGHIGSFSIACWYRGARNIHIFEADHDNYVQILKNIEGMDGITAHNKAVWRSDKPGMVLHHTGYSFIPVNEKQLITNTGGGNVFWTHAVNTGEEIETVSLDEIIAQFGEQQIGIVKVDAETSEFPILLTSTLLTCVDEIVGEFHEVGGTYNGNYIPDHAKIEGITEFTIQVLETCLQKHGFQVTHRRSGDSNLGYFHATRG